MGDLLSLHPLFSVQSGSPSMSVLLLNVPRKKFKMADGVYSTLREFQRALWFARCINL